MPPLNTLQNPNPKGAVFACPRTAIPLILLQKNRSLLFLQSMGDPWSCLVSGQEWFRSGVSCCAKLTRLGVFKALGNESLGLMRFLLRELPVVLLIDDEDIIPEAIAMGLDQQKCEVRIFSEAKSALDFVQAESPQVACAVMDYRMPLISGLELAAQLPESIPKILLTGEPTDVLELESQMFKTVLQKPVPFAELSASISQLVDAFWQQSA